jgi:hypothetical protein
VNRPFGFQKCSQDFFSSHAETLSVAMRVHNPDRSVTPSQIYAWEGLGPDVELTSTTERIPSEQKWYALTGRVVDAKVEADGDIHIALQDVTGDRPGTVVAEIPAKAEWCDLRKIVFGWTPALFPFRVRSGRKLKIRQPLIITVIGKAFFDIGHVPADQSNRRTDLQGYAAWEIHPVMALHVEWEPHGEFWSKA